jgi:hypothetical protein
MDMTKICKQPLALALLAVFLTAGMAFGQKVLPRDGPEGKFLTVEVPFSGDNAERTKEALEQILKSQPPSLAQVLRLDPSLLTNPEYIAPYGPLSQFLQQHPEVAHNPTYFLGSPEWGEYYRYQREGNSGNAVEAISFLTIFVLIVGSVFWIVRTIIDHRRWLRLSKLQTEANAKLMERFTSTDELLNFIQTPAGTRLMESSVVPPEQRTIGAPVGRILWSTQIGFIFLALGFGMILASGRVDTESGSVFDTLGILVIAAGIGFLISGLVSYGLSHKLGLLDSAKLSSASGGPTKPL